MNTMHEHLLDCYLLWKHCNTMLTYLQIP